jgi:hypothetical protein
MTAAAIAAALDGRRSRDGWTCRCPAHDDKTPSWSLSEGILGDRWGIANCATKRQVDRRNTFLSLLVPEAQA